MLESCTPCTKSERTILLTLALRSTLACLPYSIVLLRPPGSPWRCPVAQDRTSRGVCPAHSINLDPPREGNQHSLTEGIMGKRHPLLTPPPPPPRCMPPQCTWHRLTRKTKTNQKQKVRGMPASSNGDPEGSCSAVAAATASEQYHPLAFTVLWSPLPPITCILPFVGHMGITTSRGVACDFQGPYSVGDRDRMVCGIYMQ